MIQSPCGSTNTIAYNSFNTQVPLKRTFLEKDKHIQTQINIDNTDSSDQLLWTNPIRQSLNPQTLPQLAYLRVFIFIIFIIIFLMLLSLLLLFLYDYFHQYYHYY